MSIELTIAINLAIVAVSVGVAWGMLSGKIASLSEKVSDLSDTRATNERIDNVLTKLEGLDGRFMDKLDSLKEQLIKLDEEMADIKIRVHDR
jgi:hypothetical protein